VRSTLNIIQIVQSHFALAGKAKKHYPSRTISPSVTALQWRSSGTTSRVFIWRRLAHIR